MGSNEPRRSPPAGDGGERRCADGRPTELRTCAASGAGIGGVAGGAAGAIVATVAAVGTSLAVPDLGLVISGPVVSALAGAGAGGVVGVLVGALIGWNIPEERIMPRAENTGTRARRHWRESGGVYFR